MKAKQKEHKVSREERRQRTDRQAGTIGAVAAAGHLGKFYLCIYFLYSNLIYIIMNSALALYSVLVNCTLTLACSILIL